MAIYFFLLGIIILIVTGKLANDWGSGLAGLIYGGILFWSLRLLLILIRNIFH